MREEGGSGEGGGRGAVREEGGSGEGGGSDDGGCACSAFFYGFTKLVY